MPFYKEGVKGRYFDLLHELILENSSSITPNGQEWEKEQSPPVGQHSYITHFKIKSETEFWQACYFLQCQQPHNRPFFFFLTKLLKCLETPMYWVTELYKYCTPVPAGARSLLWKLYHLFSVFGRRKEIFSLEFQPVRKRGDWGGSGLKVCGCPLIWWPLSRGDGCHFRGICWFSFSVGALPRCSTPWPHRLHGHPGEGATFSTGCWTVLLWTTLFTQLTLRNILDHDNTL